MLGALYILVRGLVALAAAFAGWVLGGLLTRGLYRLFAGKPAPGWLPPLGKVTAACTLAVLVFLFLPLGGGDGWGWGPGWGAGPGEGEGKGKGRGDATTANGDGNGAAKKKSKNETATRTQVEIELLGGADVKDGRYYLVRRQPPAKTLAEVEAELGDPTDKLEVHLIFTDRSVATSHPAAGRLRDLLRQHKVPMVEMPGR
jgi:hypothetical protein